jgi:thiol:disulfide interchange protein DsbG
MNRLFFPLKLFSIALLALGLSRIAGAPAGAAEETVVRVAPETPVRPAPPPEPSVIDQLRARGLDVTSAGRIGRELRFWLVRAADGREALVATTREGFLMRGKIYAPDGALHLDTEGDSPLYLRQEDRRLHGLSPLTGEPPTAETDFRWRVPQSQVGPKPSGVSSVVWDHLGQATVIEEGKAGAPLVYIFIDPYCGYGRQQWSILREKVRQGRLHVRWVPVAVLSRSQSDLGVVQGLLDDPRAETLAGWMREQRVKPIDSAATKKALGLNMALFQALQAPSVPALIYKDQTGQRVTKVGLTPL